MQIGIRPAIRPEPSGPLRGTRLFRCKDGGCGFKPRGTHPAGLEIMQS